jgi:hypothetical protein
MTIANDIIFLSLRNSNVNGIGQTPMADDVSDSFKILNAWINELNLERRVTVNRIVLPTFPDLTSDVSFWSPYEHVLLTTMAVRLRQIYGLPAVDLDVQLAALALKAFNAINQQQVAPVHAGPPGTALQVIFLALRMAGRITDEQSVADGSKDVDDAFSLLVMMLAQWQRRRWLIWNEEEISFIANGRTTYTIGLGQDFNTARPDEIHAAWVRMQPFAGPNAVDLPLTIITAKEDWARTTIKDLKSLPTHVFYDSAFPVGRIHFWPVPPGGQYEMHLVVKAGLPVPSSIYDTLALPPEYFDAVVNNLACRIIVASGGQISPFLMGYAKSSLETLKMANTQIGLLQMPSFSARGSDVSNWMGGAGGKATYPFILNRDVLNGEALI